MILQENIENILNLELGDYFIEVTDFLNYNNSVSFSILESSDFVIDLWESGGWLITNSGYDNYEWTLNGNILLDIDPNTYQISPSLSGLYGVTATYDYNNGTCISNTTGAIINRCIRIIISCIRIHTTIHKKISTRTIIECRLWIWY
jgi:hypothetical protein